MKGEGSSSRHEEMVRKSTRAGRNRELWVCQSPETGRGLVSRQAFSKVKRNPGFKHPHPGPAWALGNKKTFDGGQLCVLFKGRARASRVAGDEGRSAGTEKHLRGSDMLTDCGISKENRGDRTWKKFNNASSRERKGSWVLIGKLGKWGSFGWCSLLMSERVPQRRTVLKSSTPKNYRPRRGRHKTETFKGRSGVRS